MAITLAAKDPSEVVDYVWNPIPTGDTGDTISGIAISNVVQGTVTRVATNTSTQVKVVVTGGADGEIAAIELRVTTAQGRTWEETLYIPVQTSAYAGLAAQLSIVFAEFASVPAATVKYWLAQAARIVTWENSDHEMMLCAAHYMTINGLGTTAQAEIMAQGLAGATSIRSGSLNISFGEGASSKPGDWKSTRYGSQFLPYLFANAGGPLVTGTGAVPSEVSTWDY